MKKAYEKGMDIYIQGEKFQGTKWSELEDKVTCNYLAQPIR